jgi:hypothetical protein
MSWPGLFLMIFGALLSLIGIAVFFLLAWFKESGGQHNVVKLAQAEFRLSHPALVIFVMGVALMVSPFLLLRMPGTLAAFRPTSTATPIPGPLPKPTPPAVIAASPTPTPARAAISPPTPTPTSQPRVVPATLGPLPKLPTPTPSAQVTLTLYVDEGSSAGPVLAGVQVTGQTGNISFSQVTNSSGYVTITGAPGTWSFTASKAGYQTNTWSQSITATATLHAFLILQLDISGRWKNSSGFFDFTRTSTDRYTFVESDVSGVEVGKGTANRVGKTLSLEGEKKFVGSYKIQMEVVSGSLMKGTVVFGFSQPVGGQQEGPITLSR